jgi:hypothetical protein
VTLDVRAVSWEHPQRLPVPQSDAVPAPPQAKPKPDSVRAVPPPKGGPYRARLTLPGAELWRCRHQHRDSLDARRCGFRTWQLLREWLAMGDAPALTPRGRPRRGVEVHDHVGGRRWDAVRGP